MPIGCPRCCARPSGFGPRGPVHIVIAADTADGYRDIEAQARLLAADIKPAHRFRGCGSDVRRSRALTEFVARLKPSLVIAVFGGSALADGRELARASVVARAPILLVR